jgi:hypothetical protein
MNDKSYSASKIAKLLPTMNSGELWQLVGGIAVELLQRRDDVLEQPMLFLRKNGRYSPEAAIAISSTKALPVRPSFPCPTRRLANIRTARGHSPLTQGSRGT